MLKHCSLPCLSYDNMDCGRAAASKTDDGPVNGRGRCANCTQHQVTDDEQSALSGDSTNSPGEDVVDTVRCSNGDHRLVYI